MSYTTHTYKKYNVENVDRLYLYLNPYTLILITLFDIILEWAFALSEHGKTPHRKFL